MFIPIKQGLETSFKLDFKQIEILLDGKKIPHRKILVMLHQYSRNRIRHNVLPELELTLSGAEYKIANAAREISEPAVM